MAGHVAPDDGVPLGVVAEPFAALGDQLVHLVPGDPVVLVAPQGGQEDVEVREEVADAGLADEPEGRVGAGAGGVGVPVRPEQVDVPSQGLERAPHGPAGRVAGREGGDGALEGDGDVREGLAFLGPSVEGGAEAPRDRDRHERRGGVGAGGDVVRDGGVPAGGHEGDGVDVQGEHELAPLLVRPGVAHGGAPEAEVGRVEAVGMLVEQETEVGGGTVGGGDGNEHASPSPGPDTGSIPAGGSSTPTAARGTVASITSGAGPSIRPPPVGVVNDEALGIDAEFFPAAHGRQTVLTSSRTTHQLPCRPHDGRRKARGP